MTDAVRRISAAIAALAARRKAAIVEARADF
jgi:hypothetical protein